MTNDEVIARALKIRDEISAIKKRHVEELVPYENGLQAIEHYLLGEMLKRKETSVKTKYGTAFQSEQIRVSMEDRDALLRHAIGAGDFGFFTNHVAKEHVKAFMDDHEGAPPPGVKVDRFIACHIRKP